MGLIWQVLLNGIFLGGLYALMALGLALVWGVLNIVNLAHGAFIMIGACPAGADHANVPFNHSAEAVFDDAVLADGTALYAELALRRLAAAAR